MLLVVPLLISTYIHIYIYIYVCIIIYIGNSPNFSQREIFDKNEKKTVTFLFHTDHTDESLTLDLKSNNTNRIRNRNEIRRI